MTHPLIFLILLTLPTTPFGYFILSSSLSCRAKCYIDGKTSLLFCSYFPIPDGAIPLKCIAAPDSHGMLLTIGEHEAAQDIAPNGLAYFGKVFANKSLSLILNVNFKALRPTSLLQLKTLLRLTLSRLPPKFALDRCLLADQGFAELRDIKVNCRGSNWNAPFDLVLARGSSPNVTLGHCMLTLSCFECEGPYSGALIFRASASGGLLKKSKRLSLADCPKLACSRADIGSCLAPRVEPTAAAQTAITTVTTAVSSIQDAQEKTKSGKLVQKPARPSKGMTEEGTEAKESDDPNLSQLVNSLAKRTQRTQRFLIIILIVSVINSCGLIILMAYLCRRSRTCRGRSTKGTYIVAKERRNMTFLGANKAC